MTMDQSLHYALIYLDISIFSTFFQKDLRQIDQKQAN